MRAGEAEEILRFAFELEFEAPMPWGEDDPPAHVFNDYANFIPSCHQYNPYFHPLSVVWESFVRLDRH